MGGDSRRLERRWAALSASVAIGLVAAWVAGTRAAQEPAPARPQGGTTSPRAGKDDPAKAPAKPKAKARAKAKPRDRRDPPGFYMGRQIADVMSWEGVDWLFRETRIEEEQPEAMLDALKIPKGATVADVGSGAGYHSIRLARRVGP